jgi:signal transduction histidine kinase
MNEALDLKIGELSEANVGLGESNRLKSEFLANVSHELRTPLNSIIGFADLLEEIARSEAAPDPKRLRYIGNIQRSGRSLLDMINSLLDMAKIEAGRMEVTVAPASAADVVEGLQAIMRPLAQQKRIDLQARVADGLPKVETDAGKLQQILYNYLSNAIKFSPEDGAVIVSVVRAERGGVEAVRISVTDHGPGIPEDMQETIFEKFRQVDASHTRRAGGTGLGLAICRELADLMGCSVGLVSASGKGSTFWVEVPVVHRPRELRPLMADAAVTRP